MDIQALIAAVAQSPSATNLTRLRTTLHENVESGKIKAIPANLTALCQRLLRLGYPRDVLDLLVGYQGQQDIEHIRALALVNSGAPLTAAAGLELILASGQSNGETLTLLARTHKELARRAGDKSIAATHWQNALDVYLQAFSINNDPYPGINVATTALRLGQHALAQHTAKQVAHLCHDHSENDFWKLATNGEALLISGQLADAKIAYAKAAELMRDEISTLGTVVRQARELLSLLDLPEDTLDEDLKMVQIAIFAGHRSPTDTHEAYGSSSEIKQQITKFLASNRIAIGYAAAADGSDILFLEALFEAGGQVHVVLPTDVPDFLRHSVRDNQPEDWHKRFHDVIAQATSLTIVSDGMSEFDDVNLRYANEVTLGLAKIKAAELGTHVVGLSVWKEIAGGAGSTTDSIESWQRQGLNLHHIDPVKIQTLVTDQPTIVTASESTRQVMGIVFADVVKYSTLQEPDVARYFKEMLPKIAALISAGQHPPEVSQTFGDALYLVYAEISDAADFAIKLQALFDGDPFITENGMALKIRIALHAGPLLSCHDPISRLTNYTGRHTSRAARIESITPENQIMATQQFAALLAVRLPDQYELAYLGERILPKSFGAERLYVVQPKTT